MELPIVSAIGGRLSRRRFVVLAYHGVDDQAQFESQLTALMRHRQPVSLPEVEAGVASGSGLPGDSFLVTFDDGRRSVLERGMPVLRRLGVPAALFVVTDLIGTDAPFWWDEVEQLSSAGGTTPRSAATGRALVDELKRVPNHERVEVLEQLRSTAPAPAPGYPHLDAAELLTLERAGIAIGSHSRSHPCLDRCTDDELIEELAGSRAALERTLGHTVRSLAYPNGNCDRRVVAAAEAAGYELGFLFDHRLAARDDEPLSVSRVRVNPSNPERRFRSIVAGVHPAVHRARGRS